ncbi:MAG: excinuclease ABC subunit UvrA [Clostridia bacterium]|nr:excinuclease ABC subunit UvrA [Clostridia bacterium]
MQTAVIQRVRQIMNTNIIVKNARDNNLKGVDVTIPRDKLVVFTGISGSGKSSLAFDTIFAEGQRRYIESLSAYARQFLGQMNKPNVEYIEGLSPAISIDQRTTSKNPRSTVGTVTEIYDYLRLLFARVGTPYCPNCGREIVKQSIDTICDKILSSGVGAKVIIYAPIVRHRKGEYNSLFEQLKKSGYVRVKVDNKQYELGEEINLAKTTKHSISVVVDRIVIKPDVSKRLTDSVESALKLADGLVITDIDGKETLYSSKYACPECDITIEELEPRMFSFNSPFGACPTCMGLGVKTEFDVELMIPDKSKSLNDGAVRLMGFSMDASTWMHSYLNSLARKYDFSCDVPVSTLSDRAMDILLNGSKESFPVYNKSGRLAYNASHWEGLLPMMKRRYSESSSDDIRAEYEKFMTSTPCPDCNGMRLKREVLSVRIADKNIYEISQMSIDEALDFFENLVLDSTKSMIASVVLKEIKARLRFLINVGLNYLTLSRPSATLSGGEAQRIRLATQIGSGLVGVLYILDEPSIGLHQRDNQKLIQTLKNLRDLGNTLIVVEHDEETIMAADHIIDMGVGAGVNGGEIVATGSVQDIIDCKQSVTGQYLSGARHIDIPITRRQPKSFLTLQNATKNNLKDITVDIPLGCFVAVTGVSGSGKSSLINETLLPFLSNKLNNARYRAIECKHIIGYEQLDKVINIDQSPIGRTPRSNPATYTNLFNLIRDLFASTPDALERGYKSGRFSFNIEGGRCENCKGDGILKIEMNFLPDVYVPCPVCHGARYNRETLQVMYKGKTIADVLDMTIDEACDFFSAIPSISRKLQTIYDVGLGYIKLGQSATTLSGGEAQRIKLATELARRSTGKTMYLLDEPTTGLHMADVDILITILQRLVSAGNTVVVIEHNLDIIKVSDYCIDLGPEGGNQGGEVIACGTPEQLAQNDKSYTGIFLKEILNRQRRST